MPLWLRASLIQALMALSAAGWATEPAQANYMLGCQGCHVPDGSGFPDKVPNMNGELAKFLHVPGGREFLIRVPGAAQSTLSDAELAAVTNWMLTSFDAQHLPADFVPYSAAEVTAIRAQGPLVLVPQVRANLMEQIDALGLN